MHVAKLKISKLITLYGFLSTNFERTIEYCSRCCYNSENNITDNSWEKYIEARIKQTHESVIEHNTMTFLFVGHPSKTFDNWEKVFYEGNNLIKAERGIYKEREYLILSGNIHMYRDLIKNMKNCNTKYKMIIFEMFNQLTWVSDYNNIFLIGLPDYQDKEGFIKDKILLDRNRKHKIKLIPLKTGDNEIFADILNLDNPLKFSKLIQDGVIMEIIRDNFTMFGSITFKIKNPRIISQQDSRHRIQGMSQKSQRYVDSSEGYEYYKPADVDCTKAYKFQINNKNIELSYNEYMELAKDMYSALRDDGVKKETARFTLTNATYTEYCITKPFYTLQHYFNERTSNAAQYEIRIAAIAIKEYINKYIKKNFKGCPTYK